MGKQVVEKNLDAVTSTGAGDKVETMGHTVYTMMVDASSVTNGGTVKFQASPDGSTWIDLGSSSVSGDGQTEVKAVDYAYRYIRANLSSRTDGTYTVWVMASGSNQQGDVIA